MAQGFQVFNADGTLQFDTSNRLYRTLTQVASGTADGAVTVADATQGTVVGVALDVPLTGTTPVVAASGATVSWSFGGVPAAERRSVTIEIGVY